MSSHLERKFALLWKAHDGPLPLRHEVPFHPTRKWRFDFAHAASKVAIAKAEVLEFLRAEERREFTAKWPEGRVA